MLGDSSRALGSSGEHPPASGAGAHDDGETGGAASNSGEEDKGREEEGYRSFGGNRWPRQETLALLKIRSDMDVVFRDSGVKGPLWEEVSRKLAELGYHRSSKKCKEKFENVYKYHKRTKEAKSGRKPDGKTYRFSDQLQALETHSRHPPPQPDAAAPQPMSATNPPTVVHPRNMSQTDQSNVDPPALNLIKFSQNPNIMSNSSSSSPTCSDEGLMERRRGRKRKKWKGFFERMMNEVINKQDELQKRLMEAIDKQEHERNLREESWRMQEMGRIHREREILAQERSIAGEKDAEILAFLQKISETQQPQPPPPPAESGICSRWPKVEVEALIKLRTNMDSKYEENEPKGPLWEEISAAMKKLGYNRSSKRCKEKWENINKYFKKVKESNRRRSEDSKTCPYFPLLDSLYKEKKNKFENSPSNPLPIMVRPEQQWPPPPFEEEHRRETLMEDNESNQMNPNQEDDDSYV